MAPRTRSQEKYRWKYTGNEFGSEGGKDVVVNTNVTPRATAHVAEVFKTVRDGCRKMEIVVEEEEENKIYYDK